MALQLGMDYYKMNMNHSVSTERDLLDLYQKGPPTRIEHKGKTVQ